MLTFYEKYKDNGKYSQNGEWGIIKECIKRIIPIHLVAVEFGAPDFYYCSNVAELEEYGWNIEMYDLDPHDMNVTKYEITPENINQIVGEWKPTILSIDIDGQDYWVWKAYKGKPDIVIIEINSSKPPLRWDVPGDEGCSYWPMVDLGKSKGYFLVCHTGNLIFCLNKHKHLFPEIIGDPILDYPQYFNTTWLC